MAARTARRVVVDDTDPRIEYSGTWYLDYGGVDCLGANGAPFQHTTHSTNTNASNLSFHFQGSQLEVYGVNAGKNISDPSWTCLLDGVSIGSAPPSTYLGSHFPLCNATTIADGTHTLTISVTALQEPFWFDYISYIPSASVPLEPAVVRVDRLDPAIVYDSVGWTTLDGATITQTAGARFALNFTGKSISWVGYIPRELSTLPASATYAIDGGKSELIRLGGLTNNSTSLFSRIFYKSPDLNPGPHSLVVSYNGDSTTTPLTLNYLLIFNASESATSLPSGTPSIAITHSNNDESEIGAIAGVVGGLVVLCFSAFLLWRGRNHQRKVHSYENSDIGLDNEAAKLTTRPLLSIPTMVEASTLDPLGSHHGLSTTLVEFNPYNPEFSSGVNALRANSQIQILKHPSNDLSRPTGRVGKDGDPRIVADEVTELPPGYTLR